MKRYLIALSAVLALGGAAACQAPFAFIGRDATTHERVGYYVYEIKPVPHDPSKDGGSDTHGTVTIEQHGTQLTIKALISGLAPKLPHAQHLHGDLTATTSACPTLANDKDGNGLIDTPEGVPAYGGIQVSLTTSGDSSPASALAVDRFPVANADGGVGYTQTVTVSNEVAANVERLHFVIHGVDLNNNGSYDMGAGPSPLDASLPLEATLPAACGGLSG